MKQGRTWGVPVSARVRDLLLFVLVLVVGAWWKFEGSDISLWLTLMLIGTCVLLFLRFQFWFLGSRAPLERDALLRLFAASRGNSGQSEWVYVPISSSDVPHTTMQDRIDEFQRVLDYSIEKDPNVVLVYSKSGDIAAARKHHMADMLDRYGEGLLDDFWSFKGAVIKDGFMIVEHGQ